MSVTMTKGEGVTVFTLTSDPQSLWPPVCQILKNLCYNPVCCSVSERLRRVQRTSQSVLGALQIMIGLLNIGLGVILSASDSSPWYTVISTAFPFWLGGIFIFFGAVSILSEKCPSPCLVIINVILNVAGVALAITAIVLYSINIANMEWRCNYYFYNYNSGHTPSPQLYEICVRGNKLALMILQSIDAVLIVLSVLELCVVSSSVILGIKALRCSMKRKDESTDDPELYRPLLKEVTSYPTV
ncbi:uncharacterized protein ABDE67_020255 [Symphorus nematophorus]